MADPIPAIPPVAPGFRQKSPGTAVAALVLGLLSFLLSVLAGIPAVICGHLALSKINQSGGTMDGKGKAITGLVLG